MAILRGLFGKVKDGPRANPFGVPTEGHLATQREKTRPLDEALGKIAIEPKTYPSGTRLLGLRIDVDTHEGMRDGVPKLLEVLKAAGVKGTFYLAMGPDRSGLAIFNVLTRPGFLAKMLRSGAPKVYSLRTMVSGTLLPSRPVASAFPEIAKRVEAEGHETGVHAWDHRLWQDKLDKFPEEKVILELERAAESYAATLGHKPRTFAAPAWFCSVDSLRHQDKMGLLYASDCRGMDPFFPVLDGRTLKTPQVPATLPTLDEALGLTDKDASAFYDRMLDEVRPDEWPVLTIHAELEGGPFAPAFAAFLAKAKERGIEVLPLRDLLAGRVGTGKPIPRCTMSYGAIEGRHGVVSVQMLEV
jgi:undecaprenyl phosphate-alpha-L-ara4FN deformylase